MSNQNLAVPELGAVEITGINRQAFILKGALAAGAVYGAGAVSPFVRQALGQEAMGDVDILNFALTLELLEADFYTRVGKEVKLSGDAKSLATEFGKAEEEHVDALSATIEQLGGKPVAEPEFTFPDAKDQESFLMLAQVLEDTGVSAYNGAAPAIESKEVLAAAGSIVQIEARHAAAIRLLIKENPAPDAFDKTLSEEKVLEAIKPFIKA
ncbi:MAG: ferritin-like domain-containing protein [Thermoleophilaceae bacterium]|nr:ferritin-like domain-containing protein [Thermoleophilaceae bacterium]